MCGSIANIILCVLTALSLFVAFSEAYTGLISPDAENPGKCVYRGDILKVGLTSGTAPCQQLTCNEDGSILIEGCGKIRIKDCNRGERLNLDKPYPECCKLKYKCKNPDGSSYYIETDAADSAIKTENSA